MLGRISDGQILWQSQKLETNSLILKVCEEMRKIIVGLQNGKAVVIKYWIIKLKHKNNYLKKYKKLKIEKIAKEK
jgi:tRNA (Thr-GGU) A37 N-methylase